MKNTKKTAFIINNVKKSVGKYFNPKNILYNNVGGVIPNFNFIEFHTFHEHNLSNLKLF